MRRFLAYYAAPCLLLCVAAVHQYNVHFHDQVSAQGGGFGMFASTDVVSTRMLRIYLVSGADTALVVDAWQHPALRDLEVPALLARPTPALLEATARRVGQVSWTSLTAPAYDTLAARLPRGFRSYLYALDRAQTPDADPAYRVPPPPRIAVPSLSSDSTIFAHDAVVAELWGTRFDAAQRALVANRLIRRIVVDSF